MLILQILLGFGRLLDSRALFHHVRKSPVIGLRELAEPRRRAELVCFLWQSYSDAVDQAVDMFDKLLTRAHTQAQNELDEQLGRIFKTEFILQYLSEPELRRRIRRGLLKVEQLHALARDVFYGRRGRINARELWEQMNTCSCLNLILACIVYWQGREISRVLSQCDPVANGIDLSLLEHVSPIEWDNIVLYGQYIPDRKLVRQRRHTKKSALAYKITRISLVPFI